MDKLNYEYLREIETEARAGNDDATMQVRNQTIIALLELVRECYMLRSSILQALEAKGFITLTPTGHGR